VFRIKKTIEQMNIQLFGITREIVGGNQLSVPEQEGIKTVGELKSWLNAQYPAMEQLNALAVAVDHAYAEDEAVLHSGQEVALIPPVSGG
jgi:molybdopterin synthase sulfur carrier subunit